MEWTKARKWIGEHRVEALAFAAGSLLRMTHLRSASMLDDEALTWVVARAEPGRIFPLLASLQRAPPFYFLSMHYWLTLFPDPLAAMRWFSVLCGLSSLLAFFFLARRLTPKSMPVAFILACLSSFWISLSQVGKPDGLHLLACVLQSYWLLALVDRWSLKTLGFYWLTAAMGLHTHYYFIFVIMAHFSYGCWQFRAKGKNLAAWTAAHAFLAVAVLPWIPFLLLQMKHHSPFPEWFTLGRLSHTLGLMFFDVFLVDLLKPAWMRAIGGAIGASMGIILLMKAKGAGLTRAQGFCAFHLIAVVAAAKGAEWAIASPMTQPRYLVCLSPWLFLLAASLLQEAQSIRGRLAQWTLVILVASGTAAAYAGGPFIDPHLDQKAQVMRNYLRPKDAIVHLYNYNYAAMRYYYLPEFRHYMTCAEPQWTPWEALPGYSPVVTREQLALMERCFFLDPQRRLSSVGFGFADCRRLAEFVCPPARQ